MLVVGLSGGHDANFCVVRDGQVLGAWEKERFTRRRHDFGDVTPYLARALAWLGLTPDDIDLVATSEPIRAGMGPGHTVLAGERYRRADEWCFQQVEVLGRRVRAVSVPHHLAHAAYARYLSPAASTAVLTWDAGGDVGEPGASAATTLSTWKGGRLEGLERIDGYNLGSLWYLYAAQVFGDENAAGRLMGLSALGSGRLDDELADAFVVGDRALGGAPLVHVRREQFEAPPFADGALGWEQPQAQEVAHAVQQLTTSAGVALATRARQVTGMADLALAGGVALNGYLNEAIRSSAGFDHVFVPPAVDDGGLAVGCALFASHHVMDEPWPAPVFPREFLGYGPDAFEEERPACGRLAEQLGLRAHPTTCEEAEDLAIRALVRGEAIAWFDGRAEHGPRALGNRSILCLADRAANRDRLNAIKGREPFRPVAPVVLESDVGDLFDGDAASPWMMFIVSGTARAASEVPAALHVDGTARVQTTTTATALGRMVAGVREQTGVGCLVNTSFNIGAPIVDSPRDAIETFAGSGLDRLFIAGSMVTHDAGAC